MSRHSRGDESGASRRSRRRVEEPSITEWLDSGSYGPYAADANRGLPEEPVSTELPPPYEPPPPPAYEPPAAYDTGSYGGSAYGGASAEVPPSSSYGSYGAAPVDQAPSGYDTGSYGGSGYDGSSYGSSAYGAASENLPSS